jgi:CBS domain-containing protein
MTSSRVSHPILRLEVVEADGTRTTDHRVFCRLQRSSIRVDECCDCVHCDVVKDGEAPSVDCTIPVRPLDPADDPQGESIEVGTLLCRGTVVLAEGASAGRALRLLREEDRRSVAIVSAGNVLVGVVHEAGFMGRMGPARVGSVGAAMSTAVAVHERTPVRVALKLLAASHLREATVVSDDGVPIGVFRDVDGLRWLAGARDAAADIASDADLAALVDHDDDAPER